MNCHWMHQSKLRGRMQQQTYFPGSGFSQQKLPPAAHTLCTWFISFKRNYVDVQGKLDTQVSRTDTPRPRSFSGTVFKYRRGATDGFLFDGEQIDDLQWVFWSISNRRCVSGDFEIPERRGRSKLQGWIILMASFWCFNKRIRLCGRDVFALDRWSALLNFEMGTRRGI